MWQWWCLTCCCGCCGGGGGGGGGLWSGTRAALPAAPITIQSRGLEAEPDGMAHRATAVLVGGGGGAPPAVGHWGQALDGQYSGGPCTKKALALQQRKRNSTGYTGRRIDLSPEGREKMTDLWETNFILGSHQDTLGACITRSIVRRADCTFIGICKDGTACMLLERGATKREREQKGISLRDLLGMCREIAPLRVPASSGQSPEENSPFWGSQWLLRLQHTQK